MGEVVDWTNGVVAIYGRGHSPVGTGFVVSSKGLTVTCAHVLEQAGWPYSDWDSPVEVRFKASGRTAQAFALEDCFRSLIEGDMAVLALEKALPAGVEVLPLSAARGLEGHAVRMWGYPRLGEQGLGGHGQVVALVPGDHGEKIQIESTNTTRGYSGGPVWDPVWKRVVGMILEARIQKRTVWGAIPTPTSRPRARDWSSCAGSAWN